MGPLEDLIRLEIDQDGYVTFERFMELALYHPNYGYYRRASGRPRTGRTGDYFTSVSVGPLFGRLWARQLHEAWNLLGNPEPFWIVEQGAEDGALACDILQWCRGESPDFLASVSYGIVEPEDSLNRLRQREQLGKTGFLEKTTWFDEISEVRAAAGVILTNELMDAFPIRRVTFRNKSWREAVVTLDEQRCFSWGDTEIDDEILREAVRDFPAIEGYTTEVNLRAHVWMREAGLALERGYIFTVDYGFPASVYYAPHRSAGTLTGYREHRRVENPLLQPGEVDLTAHVDFTALARAGTNAGWMTLGFLDQQHFLLGVAHDELAGSERWKVGIKESTGAWNMLTHPSHLGTRFQILIQGKNAPGGLAGLRYGGSGVSQLGL